MDTIAGCDTEPVAMEGLRSLLEPMDGLRVVALESTLNDGLDAVRELKASLFVLDAAFGPGVIDAAGGLDRAAMRQIVFADAGAKARLESILHPLIGAETQRQAAAAGEDAVVVFDVPLLVESGRWRAIVDRVLVVDATEETQLKRVVARSGWAPEAVKAVIAQQATRRARRAAADAVIYNESLTLEELAQEVRGFWERWAKSGTR